MGKRVINRQIKRVSLTNSDKVEGDNTKQTTYKRAPSLIRRSEPAIEQLARESAGSLVRTFCSRLSRFFAMPACFTERGRMRQEIALAFFGSRGAAALMRRLQCRRKRDLLTERAHGHTV